MVDKIKSTEGKDRATVREGYSKPLQRARRAICAAYEKALSTNRYRQNTAAILRDFTDNRVKFIYAIQSDGTLRMIQESLEPGAERPTHSELAGGGKRLWCGRNIHRGWASNRGQQWFWSLQAKCE